MAIFVVFIIYIIFKVVNLYKLKTNKIYLRKKRVNVNI